MRDHHAKSDSVSPVIRRFPSLEKLTAAASERVVQVARDAAHKRDRAMIALSGGSTPKSLYERLTEDSTIRASMPWAALHVFWGDERHVPPSHPDSNYGMAFRALIDRVPIPPDHIHRIQGEWPDAEAAAADYQVTLRHVFGLDPGVVPAFDLILLGLGPEGHTASIFPGSPAIREPLRLVMAPWVEKLRHHRITFTSRVLNAASTVIVLAAGEEKAAAVKAALEGPEDRDGVPAQLLRDSAGSVEWFLDEAAAARLIGR